MALLTAWLQVFLGHAAFSSILGNLCRTVCGPFHSVIMPISLKDSSLSSFERILDRFCRAGEAQAVSFAAKHKYYLISAMVNLFLQLEVSGGGGQRTELPSKIAFSTTTGERVMFIGIEFHVVGLLLLTF